MQTFAFSKNNHFNGKNFYEKYKNATFLKDSISISNILTKLEELQQTLDTMLKGGELVIEGMFLTHEVPLVIKKSGYVDESDIGCEEFTLRRLSGLVAVHLYENTNLYPIVFASEPESLGIFWSKSVKLYLSAISGAEFFEDFSYYPFICALRKYQLKKITAEQLIHIAMILQSPISVGEPLVLKARRDYQHCKTELSSLFGSNFDLEEVIKTSPQVIQNFFVNVIN